MIRTSRVIALAAVLVAASWGHGIGSENHIKAPLNSQNGSTVTGFVQLTQLPHGGANLNVIASGLTPGQVYTSFYYESADCSEPGDALATFTADATGAGQAKGKIDDDLDEVGSVSIRLGPGYGTLEACAQVH